MLLSLQFACSLKGALFLRNNSDYSEGIFTHSRSFSLGWHLLWTSLRSVMVTWAYTWVDSSEAWPKSSWMCRMLALFLSMCVAQVCRKVWGETVFLIFAFFVCFFMISSIVLKEGVVPLMERKRWLS